VTPRRDYRFNDQVVEYLEKSYSLRSGLSYNDAGEFADQSIGLSFTTSVLDSTLPLDQSGALDPYASPTIEPLRGLINVVRASYNVSNTDNAFDAAGPARGIALSLALDVADDFVGSEESLYQGTYRATGYIAMPWPGHHTLALRTGGGLATGTFARRGVFFVGGLNLENTSLLDQLTSGAFNGAFALRGYETGIASGRAYLLQNIEYRIPLAEIDAGPSTLPLYFRRLDGNLFLDYGGAFNKLRYDRIKMFHNGAIIDSPDMRTSVGAEIWLGATLAYVANLNLRLGYAFGLSNDRIPSGQTYFIASSAF
jgi:outer membrane protein assembly factor BamA